MINTTKYTYSTANRRSFIIAAVLCLCVVAAGLLAGSPESATARGHSPYSYKTGWNCKPGKVRADGTYPGVSDPVSVQMVTTKTVSQISQQTFERSQKLRDLNPKQKLWPLGGRGDVNDNQQGYYYNSSGNRVCSNFSGSNATGIAVDTRYHLRFHTGGESSSYKGYNIVAGTPHYDKLCGPSKYSPKNRHEIWTWDGARTQFLKLWPQSQFRRVVGRVRNTAPRKMKCLKRTVRADGIIAYVFADDSP